MRNERQGGYVFCEGMGLQAWCSLKIRRHNDIIPAIRLWKLQPSQANGAYRRMGGEGVQAFLSREGKILRRDLTDQQIPGDKSTQSPLPYVVSEDIRMKILSGLCLVMIL